MDNIYAEEERRKAESKRYWEEQRRKSAENFEALMREDRNEQKKIADQPKLKWVWAGGDRSPYLSF